MKAIYGALALLRHARARVRAIYEDGEQARRCAPWFAIDGDRTLRLDYPLNPDSIAFDVGAYKGDWASDIHARFRCRIHAFEPVSEFAAFTARRFEHNPLITVHAEALGARTGTGSIALSGDASGRLTAAATSEPIAITGVADFFARGAIKHVDLMKINIEGDEYELIQAMDEARLLSRITYIQVQFHPITGSDALLRRAHDSLRKTHDVQWEFPYVWESWRLRK